MVKTYIIVGLGAYLLGSIPFGLILVKTFLGTDVREVGSGNIGATNVARAGGHWLAFATLFLDALKSYAAVYATLAWARSAGTFTGEIGTGLAALAALGAVIGHCFPIWLRFKGGKGVATALGAFLALAPKAVLVAFIAFVVVLVLTRYVSLGSIVSAATFPVAAYFVSPEFSSSPILSVMIAVSLLIIGKHHENIRRIMSGAEHRLGAKSQEGSA